MTPNITQNNDACVATKMGAEVRYVSAPVKASQGPQAPCAKFLLKNDEMTLKLLEIQPTS